MNEIKMTPADYSAMAKAMFDILFENDKLGEFDLLVAPWCIKDYTNDMKAVHIRAKVVFKRNGNFMSRVWRLPVIVLEINGKYQDFYYNDSDQIWKQLSEEEHTIQSWWEAEELGMNVKVPEFLEGVHVIGPREFITENGDYEKVIVKY